MPKIVIDTRELLALSRLFADVAGEYSYRARHLQSKTFPSLTGEYRSVAQSLAQTAGRIFSLLSNELEGEARSLSLRSGIAEGLSKGGLDVALAASVVFGPAAATLRRDGPAVVLDPTARSGRKVLGIGPGSRYGPAQPGIVIFPGSHQSASLLGIESPAPRSSGTQFNFNTASASGRNQSSVTLDLSGVPNTSSLVIGDQPMSGLSAAHDGAASVTSLPTVAPPSFNLPGGTSIFLDTTRAVRPVDAQVQKLLAETAHWMAQPPNWEGSRGEAAALGLVNVFAAGRQAASPPIDMPAGTYYQGPDGDWHVDYYAARDAGVV